MRKKLIDLMDQRAKALEKAEGLLSSGNQTEYAAEMETIKGLNKDIQSIQTLLEEQDKKFFEKAPNPSEERDKAESRAVSLMKGDAVKFSAKELLKAFFQLKATTLATGTIVQPTGAGSMIHDPLGNHVSSIVDQVTVQDLSGMASYMEPYVITELDAKGGKVSTNAGKARTASAEPTFGVAKIAPYELNVTGYVDRNISRLSPADYYAKIYGMAMRAIRRELAKLIANGDGQGSPDMYGIKTAKNMAGAAIYSTVNVSAIDENILDELFFSYGSEDELGLGARLYLSKADLKALGKFRNTDKERVYKIHPDATNPNSGTIEDGGTFLPYTILNGLTSLSVSKPGGSDIQTMLYGDPANYLLGLFGDYSIRVDESIKGVERMYTILGDAMVGGNLVVHNGFSVATVPHT